MDNAKRESNPYPSRILAGLSAIVGGGALVAFIVFLYAGSVPGIDLGLGVVGALTLDASLCLVFFLQHSGMIRPASRSRMSRLIPEQHLGAVFSIVSGAVLWGLLILWQESTFILASADGLLHGSLQAVFLLALGVNAWGIWSLRSADIFGVRPLLRGSNTTHAPGSIVLRGPYRWVRHPLYLTTLVMIWAQPDLTADRLLFDLLFTGWIIWGTVLEERDLVAAHGAAYREYQQKVPMLIPYRKTSRVRLQ